MNLRQRIARLEERHGTKRPRTWREFVETDEEAMRHWDPEQLAAWERWLVERGSPQSEQRTADEAAESTATGGKQ